ncbi:MAG: hypothetical protein J6X94_01585 [Lachnospiraceae bacterium]|nr:hypothetical protein [Lachnospiraceae bacterium]
MEKLLFVVLLITEIVFAIREITLHVSKKEWAAGRGVVNVTEFVLFLLMLVLPGIDLSIRFKALFFLLIVRLAVSGIAFSVFRKNEKRKKNVSIVLGTVFGIILIAVSMLPAFIFKDYSGRPVSGPYSVAQSSAILIDNSRMEANETDGSFREVPVYFFYPECIEDLDEGSLPLVMFSHGAFGYYESNASTYLELASNGYIVVSIEHPYHSLFTKDTNGKIITVDPEFFNNAMDAGSRSEAEVYELTSEWMDIREADMNFALDTIIASAKNASIGEEWFLTDTSGEEICKILAATDTDKIGLMGHSLGGATAVTVGRRDDVSAVIDFDGTMLGEEVGFENGEIIVNPEPYDTPILCFDSASHHADRVEAERIGYVYSNNVIMDNAMEGYSVYFEGTAHMNFTDLPLFSPVLAKNLGLGDRDPEECIDKINSITLKFFDCYLKGIGEFEADEKY